MRALSLTQPYATLIATGAKRIETRSWQTRHRGWLAIHASAGFPPAARQLCQRELFRSALAVCEWRGVLPLGAIVAVCTLEDCCPTDLLGGLPRDDRLTEQEAAFGDYQPGRWGWILGNVRALSEPIPCKGRLGLWELPPAARAALETQISDVA